MNPGIANFLSDVIGDDIINHNRNFDRFIPAVNVKETEKTFELEMAVPGWNKNDINIDLENDVLTISAKLDSEKSEHKDHYQRKEFHHSSFERSFTLPENADGNKIQAKQENGVLMISVPKKEDQPSLKKLIKIS